MNTEDETIIETIKITQTIKDGKMSLVMELREDGPASAGEPISVAYGMATCILDLFEAGFVGEMFSEKFGIKLNRSEA